MRVVRLIACTLVLSAVALASNGPLPKSASIDVKNAIEKADAALTDGDKNLALALYKGSLYTTNVRLAVDKSTLDSEEQFRAVVLAVAVWDKELEGDFPVTIVDKPEEADIVVQFVESIPFTETRLYVMAILAGREVYRTLYDLAPAAAETTAAR